MAKKIAKMKSLSTNVRYIKIKQRGTHVLLTALWHLAPHATKNILPKRFFKPTSYALTPLERQYLENGTSFSIQVHDKDDRTIPYMDSKILSGKTDHVYLHSTKGLGHKRILKDDAVVDFVTAYIFNGQIQRDEQLRRKNDKRY